MVNTEGKSLREVMGYDRIKYNSAKVLTINEIDTLSENFYLSGYEAISLTQSNYHSLKTVISSTVSFDDEILLLKAEGGNFQVKDICVDLNVNYLEMDFKFTDACVANVEVLLDTHKDISYVYLEIDDQDFSIVCDLSKRCNKARVALIINVKKYNRVNLSKCIELEIPYTIMPDYVVDQGSIVIANRRNLVQTEGVSSSFTYDLYSMWQRFINKRNTRISPMTA